MDNQTREIMVRVRERLSSPERWIQSRFAIDKYGRNTYSSSPTAVCWCLAGAVNAECNYYTPLLNAVCNTTDTKITEFTKGKYDNFVQFNDNSTYEEVMKFLDWVLDEETV